MGVGSIIPLLGKMTIFELFNIVRYMYVPVSVSIDIPLMDQVLTVSFFIITFIGWRGNGFPKRAIHTDNISDIQRIIVSFVNEPLRVPKAKNYTPHVRIAVSIPPKIENLFLLYYINVCERECVSMYHCMCMIEFN